MLFTLICVFFGLLLQASAQSGSDEPEPKCYHSDIDGWVEVKQNYPYDNGFHHRSLKDNCTRSCLELKSTLLGLEDDICNSSGHCLACHYDGYYGRDCRTGCNVMCKDGKCHIENGTCISCNDGWHGLECNNFCSDNCQNRACDRFNGACIECKDKSYYGDRCDQPCSGNCASHTCKISGECQGCAPEWHGPWCNNSCSENCKVCEKSQCMNGDSSCDAATGKCNFGCETGWTGDTCQQEQTEMNLTPIIVSVVTAVVVAAFAVPLAVIIDRRKRRNQNSGCPNNVTTKDQEPENATTEDQRQEPAGQPTVHTEEGEYLALEDDAYEMVDERLMNSDRPETESGYYHLPNQAPVYANWESTGPYETVRATNK